MGARSGPELCERWQSPMLAKIAVALYSNSRSRGERSCQPACAWLSTGRPPLPDFAILQQAVAPGWAARRDEEEG